MAAGNVCANARIDRRGLDSLIRALRARGYEVIGPSLHDSAISFGPIDSTADLPQGWTFRTGAGTCRVEPRADNALFGFAATPNSLKDFLHPASLRLFTADKNGGPFHILPTCEPEPRFAFLGVRACDLAAAGLQDQVFTGRRYVDHSYEARRRNAFIIAVQCSEPASTCFCDSMQSGPRALDGFDLALTEFTDAAGHEFFVEIGSAQGAELMERVEHSPASSDLAVRSRAVTERAAASIERHFDGAAARELLRRSIDSPEWDRVAARCFGCGNCSMVCPTCFCTKLEDRSDIAGRHAERWQRWDSCFTTDFSYIHGGSIRLSAKSRYRQWLNHKLSWWVDQFGKSGCAGCGRCIAWCPAGIDITEEIQAIRQISREVQHGPS